MDIRIARPADAASLAKLGADSFVAKFGHLYRAEDLAGFLEGSHSEAKVAKEIADPRLRVALVEDGGELLGFCKLVMDCGWPDHARGDHVIELKQLYTAPGATGQGIGACLMDWALAESANSATRSSSLPRCSPPDGYAASNLTCSRAMLRKL